MVFLPDPIEIDRRRWQLHAEILLVRTLSEIRAIVAELHEVAEDCPDAGALRMFEGRRKLVILLSDLFEGKGLCFSELERAIPVSRSKC